MKRFLVSILVFSWSTLLTFGQSTESEPNNSFSTANELLNDDPTTGSLGGGDVADFFELDFAYNANLYITLEITNTGSNGPQIFYADLFNSLNINGEYVGNFHSQGFQLQEGETMNYTITVCGLARDRFFLKMHSTGDFDYSMEWFPGNSFGIDDFYLGYNNTPANASPFSFNVEKQGSLGYEYWGNTDFDTVDYYTSTLPAGNYSDIGLKIKAQSNRCDGQYWMKYFCYKNGSSTPFASGYVGDNPSVSSLQWVNSTIPLHSLQAGDNLRVKLVTNGIFGYSFIYKPQDIHDDDEDNCCVFNAITLNQGVTKGGTVGEFNTSTQEFIDEYDTYKINVPFHGSVKMFVTAENDECNEEYYSLEADILDRFGNELNYQTLASWDGYPNCNTIITDSIKMRGFTADEFYIRLHSNGSQHGKIKYTIRYQVMDSTGNVDVEPNNTYATATPIAAGQVKKGNVRFNTTASYDNVDFYKGHMPEDGNIQVILKTTYRGEWASNDISLVTNEYFTHHPQPRNPQTALQPDSVYIDTINICGIRKGDISFSLHTTSNMPPFEYEISYIVTAIHATDNDTEPNNSFAEAKRVGSNSQQKGHINYIGQTSANTDNYDFYKMVFTTTDSLKLYLQATNVNCYFGAQSNRNIVVRGYNKNQTAIFTRTLGNNTNVAPGQTITDSIKIRVVAQDTIYVRFEANTAFKYQFTTNSRLPYSGFVIEGDTAVCTGAQTYKAINLADEPVAYHWSLPDGGGVLSFADSVATVDWTTTGIRRIQLYTSNAVGNSTVKERNVIINGLAPTQVPVAYNFARTLSTNSFPPGTTAKWYKNNVEIPGATDASYYAGDAGSYTVRFASDCGTGPASNAIVFENPAITQTITLPHAANVSMSPSAFVKLQGVASSGLPVYYQKVSGPGFIQNDTLYMSGNIAVGTIIVKAIQPGDDVYRPAAEVYDTITVVKGDQVITFEGIPDQIMNSTDLLLSGRSSAGLGITYSIVNGSNIASLNNLSGANTSLNKLGAGTVTLRALQNGNVNYNAAVPLEQSFCIGVRTLDPILGDKNPCLATYRYTTQKIPGANFVWTLSGGGVLTTHNDTAWVQWQTPGSYTIRVKANSPCDTTYTNEQQIDIVTSNNNPAPVTGMLPANNAIDQQLPLRLSWIPGANTVSYDLFLWDSSAAEPTTAYATNITNVYYTIPNNALTYNKAFKWKIISKNPCSQTVGPVQQFRLIPLADLVVSDVQAPATANSGQTITISWKVTNAGPGRTRTSESWSDAVFFSFDTIPDFRGSFNWDPTSWNALTSEGKPLVAGTKTNVAALDSGQFYTNSLNFTLPVNYSQPLYVYVITDYPRKSTAPLQVTVINDTARASQPVNVTLSPTPDLRVDSVFTPTTTFSGSTINLTYKVKNYGVLTPAGAVWTDSVFISQSPLFDRTQCIPLTSPKLNGSYYPNALFASGSNVTQLRADSTYTKSLNVVIPNFVFGTWFVYVKANAAVSGVNNLYEGALNGNNINRSQLEIFLTPTPKLTINDLSVPVTSASTTQPIGVNWNIRNDGFTDNIERSKGHDMYNVIGNCPCYAPPPGVCMGSPIYQDHPILGSSYWLDRVYLSKDPNGLVIANAKMIKEVKHGSQPYMGLLFPDVIYECGTNPTQINVATALHPGKAFPTTANFNVPSDLDTGTYYIYVYTNPTKTVFEYPGTPQIKRSDLPVIIQRPDLIVPSVNVPANSIGGQPVNINYQVVNNGPGAVFNHVRRDQLYISNFPAFDVSAQLIDVATYIEDVPVGTPVSHGFVYRMPAATTGNKYFYVRTNFDSTFKESLHTNNTSGSAVTLVSAAIPNDLIVSSVTMPDTVFTIFNNNLGYTVTNNGNGTTAGVWTDSLFVSCSPVFNRANSYYLGHKIQNKSIGFGESYSDTFNFGTPKMSYELNSCFPQTANTNAYFFLKTNANFGVYEGTNINNNVSAAITKVFKNPLVDHQLVRVNMPENLVVGRAYNANWTVKNIGYKPTQLYYYAYYDGIYFSTDSVFNNNAVLAKDFLKYNLINRNDTLNDSKQVVVPNLATGDYYALAYTNSRFSIESEKVIPNNVNVVRDADGWAKKIHIVRPLLPDLRDSITSAPVSVAVGQPLSVIHRVTNQGVGETYPATWKDELYLSSDFVISNTDRLLKTKTHNGKLLPGEFYADTLTATIPLSTIPGNYVLGAVANETRDMIESNHLNNYGFSLVDVYVPAPADLLVGSITLPDTVYLGYTIDSLKWTVRNASANEAKGITRDGVYLSTSNKLDSSAALIGIKAKNINMAPLATDSLVMAPLVDNVVEGNYRLIVKTDFTDNIPESDKLNNATASGNMIYVKVKELPMNVIETNTLKNIARFYKLIIPDSLLGSTIRITLKSGDSLTVRNEMFVGGGYIPSAAAYDYRFENPNYGNQQIVIASVTQPVYYIRVQCASSAVITQNISLKAEKLPFAILNVHTNSGGNIGNVTVKISGSLFRDSMVAKLTSGATVIYSSAVYFTNSTTVYATFNLRSRPLGVYDVALVKPNSEEAILANAFTIVVGNNGGLITGSGPNTVPGNADEPGCDPGAASGLNSQLVVDLVVPPKTLLGRPVVLQINYSNPTNSDIPVQSRILYSEAGMKLAFTREGIPNGSTSLYLELSEPGGPPGIIRAGGSGTITVYSIAPTDLPPTRYVLFKIR